MPEPTRFPETTQEYLEWVSYWEKSPASYKPDIFYIKAAEKMNYDVELVKEFLAKRRGSLAQEVVEESKASPSSLDWDWGEDELSLNRIEEKPSEKQPLSADEKPQCNETVEIIKTPVETMNTPKEDPQGLQGWDAIVKYLEAGVALIGVYENCAQVRDYNKEYAESFSNDINVVRTLWDGNDIRTKGQRKIRRFYFIPKNTGWLCLDVDRKNNKDGLVEFYSFFSLKEKLFPEHMPPEFQNLPFNFPCWVRSANNGFHLYFKYDRKIRKMGTLPDCPAVEIKYTNNLVPAGSFKNGKPYVLHGDLANIPRLPAFLEKVIAQPQVIPSKQLSHSPNARTHSPFGKHLTLQEITSELDRTCRREEGNRAIYANRWAGMAFKNHHAKQEILDALYDLPVIKDLPSSEINNAVNSAFKKYGDKNVEFRRKSN